MFGRLLRVTGSVLVIAVAFVTPVLATATATPASADTVIDGCDIVSNPTPTNFTNCPGADFSGDSALGQVEQVQGANLSGLDLSFANLAGAVFAGCSAAAVCGAATLSGANLTDANVSSTEWAACDQGVSNLCVDVDFQDGVLTGANLTDAVFATCGLTGLTNPYCGEPPLTPTEEVNLSGADLTNATLTGATFGTCVTSDSANLGPDHACGSANLTGANLTGAVLTGADFTETVLVPPDQTVNATSSAGAVVTWSTPPSLPGATLGTCTPASGSTFPINFPSSFGVTVPTAVTCQILDDQGDVATGTFGVTVDPLPAPPTTSVGIPSNGATITGSTWLDAAAQSAVGVASVNYEISGGSISDQVISGSTATLYGYIGAWNSTSVPNGTYTLQSVATDTLGQTTTSAPITLTVDNPTASTSVVSPSSGATESGTSALLDASATADVTGVTYELTGGTLTNQVVATATATFFGWAALWDTTSVPNGTYTVQSVATYSGGTVASAPITISVSN